VMRKGDIMTHMYHDMPHGILDENGKIRPSVRAARERGVLFDVGHGQGSFSWSVCETALAQDFEPTMISSDLHSHNVDGPVFDLVTTIAKFLKLGMSLDDALAKVTVVPAKVVGMAGKIGTLAVGAEADAVVMALKEGAFPLRDSRGAERTGDLRLVPLAIVKAGRIYAPARSFCA
jgi:dihydroorotase